MKDRAGWLNSWYKYWTLVEFKYLIWRFCFQFSWARAHSVAMFKYYSKKLRVLWSNMLWAFTTAGGSEFPENNLLWEHWVRLDDRAHSAGTDAGTQTCYCLWALKHCLVWWRRGQNLKWKLTSKTQRRKMTTSKRKCHCGLCNLSLLGNFSWPWKCRNMP